jgi:hypothetical protein
VYIAGVNLSGAIAAAALVWVSSFQKAEASSFVRTGSLMTARCSHTATLLPDGRVLVAGGGNFDALNRASPARLNGVLFGNSVLDTGWRDLASAEVYQPTTGTWTATGSMAIPRSGHVAVLLPSGKVLVAGGPDRSAELYDPGTGKWTLTGPMQTNRSNHPTATLLRNGQVLVAGGYYGQPPSGGDLALRAKFSAETYDPSTGRWMPTGPMHFPHLGAAASLLADGRVLVAGGARFAAPVERSGFSCEVYDPTTRSWTRTGEMNIERMEHTATLLPNGHVLVAGGSADRQAEFFDPRTGKWALTGEMGLPGDGNASILLPGGQVLVAGSANFSSAAMTSASLAVANAELYNPVLRRWTRVGPAGARPLDAVHAKYLTATLLPDGRVLFAGGKFVGTFQGRPSIVFPISELCDPGE